MTTYCSYCKSHPEDTLNNTYTADLDVRTATFLTAQGMQVTEYGIRGDPRWRNLSLFRHRE